MDDYSKIVAKAVVCQLSHGLGLEHVQSSAVSAVTEILIKYLNEAGRHVKFYSSLSGRTDPNVSDVLIALEDLQTPLREIIDYARKFKEFEFVYELGTFPYQCNKQQQQETFGEHSQIVPVHIPDFLPRFPPVHTYQATPSFVVPWPEERSNRRSAGVERREAERALEKFLKEDKPVRHNLNDGQDEIENPFLQAEQYTLDKEAVQQQPGNEQDELLQRENTASGGVEEEEVVGVGSVDVDIVAQQIIEQGPELEVEQQKEEHL
eukprot:TRINITY_DN10348_c0_g1_i1.p1 TRINITY_DN10348_c0_g1~~TRINITY_DN10348_c0_g1_i1.p1  ORF type:complete len:277 (+),score=65.99 TRINITY_DN10348_c0_g1_i1:40-831(+)